MEPPPARAARPLLRWTPFALVVLAVGGIGLALGFGPGEGDSPSLPVHAIDAPTEAPGTPTPPPALAGLGRSEAPRAVAGTAGTAAAVGASGVDSAAPATAPPTPAPAPTFLALAPGAVTDRISAGASAAFPIPRELIVGRVGAFGERDVTGAGGPSFVGVGRIERQTPPATKGAADAETPAVTALRGVVVDEDGAPVAGAEVLVYSSFYVRNAHYDHRVQQLGRMVTDGAGVFDLRPIALDTIHFGSGGEVLVTVRHPLLADVVAARLPAIVPGEETDVGRLLLPRRGAAAHGTVRDLEGRPVVGAVVRVSGALDPTAYDKTERMIVLDACPAAVTDAQGRYRLEDFAPGAHEISVHIRIDCVVHGSMRFDGDVDWSPQVLAGNAIRGRVVDPQGEPVAAAVVAGGGNWTPTNADGTFWLDNVAKGPLTLYVVHHDWRAVTVPNAPTNGDELTLTLTQPLPRVTIAVVTAAGEPVPLVAIDWAWPPGGGPRPFSTESRYFFDPNGSFAIVVPEGAIGATVSDAKGGTHTLEAGDLADGVRRAISLAAPAGGG